MEGLQKVTDVQPGAPQTGEICGEVDSRGGGMVRLDSGTFHTIMCTTAAVAVAYTRTQIATADTFLTARSQVAPQKTLFMLRLELRAVQTTLQTELALPLQNTTD